MQRIASFLKNKKDEKIEKVEERLLLWDQDNYSYVDHAFPTVFIKVHNDHSYKFYETNNPKVCIYTCEVQFDDNNKELICNMFKGNDIINGSDIIAEWTMSFIDDQIHTSVHIYSRAYKGKRIGYFGFMVFRLHLHKNHQSFSLWTNFPSKQAPWEGVYHNSSVWGDQYKYVTKLLLADPEKVKTYLVYENTVNKRMVNELLEKNVGSNVCAVNIGRDDNAGFKKDLVKSLRSTFTVKMTSLLFNYSLSRASYSANAIYMDFVFDGTPKHPMFTHRDFPSLIFERTGNTESCQYSIIDEKDHNKITHTCVANDDENGEVTIIMFDSVGDHIFDIVFSDHGNVPCRETYESDKIRGTETLRLYSYIILYDYQFLHRHLFSSEEETRERKNSGEEKGDD